MVFHVSLMTAETCFVLRLVLRFAVDKSAEPPAACGSIFFRVFDHDLNCRCRARDEGPLELIRRDALPGQFDKNGPIRKGKRFLPVCCHRQRVPHNGSKLVERTCLVGRRDHFPLPISSRDGDAENRRRALAFTLSEAEGIAAKTNGAMKAANIQT